MNRALPLALAVALVTNAAVAQVSVGVQSRDGRSATATVDQPATGANVDVRADVPRTDAPRGEVRTNAANPAAADVRAERRELRTERREDRAERRAAGEGVGAALDGVGVQVDRDGVSISRDPARTGAIIDERRSGVRVDVDRPREVRTEVIRDVYVTGLTRFDIERIEVPALRIVDVHEVLPHAQVVLLVQFLLKDDPAWRHSERLTAVLHERGALPRTALIVGRADDGRLLKINRDHFAEIRAKG